MKADVTRTFAARADATAGRGARAARPLLLVGALLGGCASFDVGQAIGQAQRDAAPVLGATTLASPDDGAAREASRAAVDAALAQPLDRDTAVRIALAHGPAVRAMLAQAWAEGLDAARAGRLRNPWFSFEATTAGGEREFTRAVSFGVFELLTLPMRASVAERRLAVGRAALAGAVVDEVGAVRQAWVRAVAARQRAAYARVVVDAAVTGAALVRRMEAVGNVSTLVRARHELTRVEAEAARVAAEHEALATREALVRRLGLDAAQAERLVLPDRLPDLPASPDDDAAVAARPLDERLDVRQARAEVDAARAAQGLAPLAGVIDADLKVGRTSLAAPPSVARSVEVGVMLPVFDAGTLARDGANARTLAATARLDAVTRHAASTLREADAARRAAWTVARGQRDEVLAIRKRIADEQLLRYNAMLVGVFDLLADARERARAVQAAIGAEERYWLAAAAFDAERLGRPMASAVGSTAASPSSRGGADGAPAH